jgi:replicative DNA helicase
MNREQLVRMEQSVIGAVLLDEGTLDLLYPTDCDSFHDLRPRTVWAAFITLRAAGKPIDAMTVEAQIAANGKATDWVQHYLGECAYSVPTPKNAMEYAAQIREAALTRRVQGVLSEVLEDAKAGRLSGSELLSVAMAGLSHLDAETPDDAKRIGELVAKRVKQLEQIAAEWATGHRTLTGFPTGVAKLDEKIGGWQPGIMTIVAARPGMGKSSLGLSSADAASKAGFGCHVFSLEDTQDAYSDRSISRTANVPAQSLRNCQVNREQMERTRDAVNELHRRRGWLVDDRSGITADEIVRSVRRHKRENNTKVVIVDYIQRVKAPKQASRHEELGDMALAFSDAAKQDGIAYVVMSQLNRGVEQRSDKHPQLSDLRESGSLEELAKCVIGVYRGAYYGDPVDGVDYKGFTNKPTQEQWERRVELCILKNNNGQVGDIEASFDGPTTRIW